jgi:predicted TPR repeat methyltransferase
MPDSLDQGYFERLYSGNADPWDFATSPYEKRKYAATLEALPRARYRRGLELGCSIGVLTGLLAQRCDSLLASDISAIALERARARCAGLENVRFEQRDFSRSFPEGSFDLIVMSEVGYYLSLPDLEHLRTRIAAALNPNGHLLLVHYTGETNYPLTADAVHETFIARQGPAWTLLSSARVETYRLDLLEAGANPSLPGSF